MSSIAPIKRNRGGWRPQNHGPSFNPKLIAKKAKLRRIVAKGLAPAGDKASLRTAAAEAAQTHTIKRLLTMPDTSKPWCS